MGKSGSLSAMKYKLKKYDVRKEIEKMLDLNQNTFALKKILQAQDAKLIAEELDIKKRGFCPSCHRVMTTMGVCSNPMCDGVSLNTKSKGVKRMSVLNEEQIKDLAYHLALLYIDDPIDQLTHMDSLTETLTEWSDCYGEHPPMSDEPLPDTEVDDNGLIYVELGKDDC